MILTADMIRALRADGHITDVVARRALIPTDVCIRSVTAHNHRRAARAICTEVLQLLGG